MSRRQGELFRISDLEFVSNFDIRISDFPRGASRVKMTVRVRQLSAWLEKSELTALFFLHGMALSIWFVPLSRVLDAHGLQGIKPLAFATSALAAFVSPLIFGAMADRHASPVKVLRGLAVATALAMALASTAIKLRWNPWLALGLIQIHALCSSPTWSISNTIVFSQLHDSKRQFGPLRAMATLGWMTGCWLVSALNADASPSSGYGGAVVWLVVAAFTFLLPGVEPPKAEGHPTLGERLGLDALSLLKNHDHRVVFLTVALFAIPLSAFYPYTPPHLCELGLSRTSAWMSLGQITEIIAMVSLGALLLRWRLKWIFTCGLGFGVLRFALCALAGKAWLLAGITLHGCSFTLVFITAQIYLEERVDPAWRARGQALMSLMGSGVGQLIGYLGAGWWFYACGSPAGMRWPLFWAGVSAGCGVVLLYFLIAYHGISSGLAPAKKMQSSVGARFANGVE
jgi:MFS family permease